MRLTFVMWASEEYASRANVAALSIKKHHPEAQVITLPATAKERTGAYVDGLAKERLRWIREKLNSCDDADRVIMMGADCVLFEQLPDDYLNILNKSAVTLVPHVVQPPSKNGGGFYKTGHANADFVGFSKRALGVLDWLLKQEMSDKINEGIFYEQTWLSILPFVTSFTGICRNPSLNFAYFNYEERQLKKDGDNYWVANGVPLAMAQFSGYEKGKPHRMSRHYGGPDATGDLLSLFTEYDRSIER